MSIQSLAQKVVDLCNQGKNFDVMHTLYADDIVSIEPTGIKTVGKQAVIKKSERWTEGVTIHGETVEGPFFNGPDRFATQTTFEITRKETDERVTIEEISVYTVRDGLITQEQFFFNGDRW